MSPNRGNVSATTMAVIWSLRHLLIAAAAVGSDRRASLARRTNLKRKNRARNRAQAAATAIANVKAGSALGSGVPRSIIGPARMYRN